MAAPRIRIAKDKAKLVQSLIDSGESASTGPFSTYADVIVFAAALGAKRQKRVPLGEIAQSEPSPISIEVFVSRGYYWVINLLAVMTTQQPEILSTTDAEAESQRVAIFEEYANGGLEQLQDELRGAVDYSERLLLTINAERNEENEPASASNGDREIVEFDLSRFL